MTSSAASISIRIPTGRLSLPEAASPAAISSLAPIRRWTLTNWRRGR